jgi:hypothetical protein
MTTQYTPTLKLALPVTGELSGTWGDVVNDNITSMVEQAIAGLATINTWTTNAHTLTTADGTTSESRCAMLVLTDTGTALSGAATVICPTASKIYIVKNTSGQSATIKTAAGTGIAVPNGETMFVFCDGTNVVQAVTRIASADVDFAKLKGTGAVVVTNILDEDNMASDSATALATQQSIKAYVDSQIAANNDLSEVLANGNTTGGTDLAVSAGDDITFTATSNAIFADNGKAIFGAGSDLQIYHDGTTSKIDGNLSVTNALTLSAGTANGVTYLNGSKVLTSGSALTFDGTNFGVGVTSPSQKLELAGVLRVKNGNADTNGLNLSSDAAGVSTINSGYAGAGQIVFQTEGTERMRLTSTSLYTASGINVGIGTSAMGSFDSFANNLVVGTGSGSEGITIYGGSADASNLSFADGTGAASYQGFIQYSHATDSLAFHVNYSGSSSARMTIDSSGNVGIATSSLAGMKLVALGATGYPATSGTTQTGVFRISGGTGLYNVLDMGVNESTDTAWMQATRANSLATYDNLVINPYGGNVGINTSSPTQKLTIEGAMNLRNGSRAGAFEIDSSGNLWMGTATTAGSIIFESGHTTTGLPSTGVERARIDSDGLKFNGDTAAANALDDYEEGTFTPALQGTATSGTWSPDYNAGTYTKVGRVVNFAFILGGTLSGAAGYLRITGLPFTVNNSAQTAPVNESRYIDITGNTQIGVELIGGITQASLYAFGISKTETLLAVSAWGSGGSSIVWVSGSYTTTT